MMYHIVYHSVSQVYTVMYHGVHRVYCSVLLGVSTCITWCITVYLQVHVVQFQLLHRVSLLTFIPLPSPTEHPLLGGGSQEGLG